MGLVVLMEKIYGFWFCGSIESDLVKKHGCWFGDSVVTFRWVSCWSMGCGYVLLEWRDEG